MMRIDSLSNSYPLERPVRPGSAVTPYRESQRIVESQRQPDTATPSTSQGLEREPQARQIEPTAAASEAGGEFFPARYVQQTAPDRPLTSRAAQALASYTTTASLVASFDSTEVLGLDLYA